MKVSSGLCGRCKVPLHINSIVDNCRVRPLAGNFIQREWLEIFVYVVNLDSWQIKSSRMQEILNFRKFLESLLVMY